MVTSANVACGFHAGDPDILRRICYQAAEREVVIGAQVGYRHLAVQNLGRPGLAAMGVSRSGAADRRSFRPGARLLAQDYTAAAIEVTFGGLGLRAHGDVMLALTGAPAPATDDGVEVAHLASFVLRDGHILRLASPTAGLRTYLSVRGGVGVPAVLGSRATDTSSGLGPAPLPGSDLGR